MSWRKLVATDIKRGTILRMTSMLNDGAYATATIISVPEGEPRDEYARKYPSITIARPYAYAHEHVNDNQPLMGCEVFTIEVSRLLGDGVDYEVFQGRDGIRSMTT